MVAVERTKQTRVPGATREPSLERWVDPRLAERLAPLGLSRRQLEALAARHPELAHVDAGSLRELCASALDAGLAPQGFCAFIGACSRRFPTLGEAARVLGARRSLFWHGPARIDPEFEARRRKALEPFLSPERRARELATLTRERNAERRAEWSRSVRELLGLPYATLDPAR